METLPSIISDRDGASIMEFGLIAPVVMVMMLGTMDIGHSYFVRAALDGAIQTVARTSSLEGTSNSTMSTSVDDRITQSILALAPNATITSTRRFYKTFSDAALARAETVIEPPTNANLRCDRGESFMDANNNGVWDADGGSDGQGGAKDIVIIKLKVSYPRLFPMAGLIGLPADIEMESNSILANQPYGEQAPFGPPVQTNCPSG